MVEAVDINRNTAASIVTRDTGSSNLSSYSKGVRLNLMIIGNSSVGKTSLMSMHVRKKFNMEVNSTSGVDFMQAKYISKDGSDCRFKIWDTGG